MRSSPSARCAQGADGFLNDAEALGVEESVESAHAVEELGQMHGPRLELFLSGALGTVWVSVKTPRCQHHFEVAMRQRCRPGHQHLFVAGERIDDVVVPGVRKESQS